MTKGALIHIYIGQMSKVLEAKIKQSFDAVTFLSHYTSDFCSLK